MINAGKYNKKIEIFSIVETEDKEGFKAKTETSILKTFAEIKTTKGFTLISSNTDFEKAYTNFTIRFPRNVTITRDMIIRYNNKDYSIEYLNDIDERHVELEMQAKVVDK